MSSLVPWGHFKDSEDHASKLISQVCTLISLFLKNENDKVSCCWRYFDYTFILIKATAIDFLRIDASSYILGFSDCASGKEPACQCRGHKRYRLDPWDWKVPLRRSWPPTPVFLPGESHGQKSLAGYCP